MIVTAQKRVQRNVDVPISITVNTAKDIAIKNIGDLTPLAEKMPKVNGGGAFNFTAPAATSQEAEGGRALRTAKSAFAGKNQRQALHSPRASRRNRSLRT